MRPPMDITFTRVDDRRNDREELVEFLTAHEFPFHATRRPVRGVVEGWIDEGRFGDADHASFWIDTDAGGSVPSSSRTSPMTPHCSTCVWPRSIAAKGSESRF
jgi:hypothetical protein